MKKCASSAPFCRHQFRRCILIRPATGCILAAAHLCRHVLTTASIRRLPVVDPVAPVLLALAAILAGARLGGDLAERIGQPAVLGELVVGIVLGNLDLVGGSWFREVAADHTLDVLARLGAVVLLFEVGLESTVGDMLKVGGRSLLVAVLGVATPWMLGWGVGALLLPNASPLVHAFL